MADDSGIDPRYAAQFQRGFDPSQHAPATVATKAAPRPDAPLRLGGGPVTTAERIPDRPVPRDRPVAVEPAASTSAPTEPDAVGGEPEPQTRRPIWEWLLLGLGVAQFLGAYVAVWSQWNSQTQGGLGFGPGLDGMLFYVFSSFLPGPLYLGGIVAVMLWIAVRALGRRAG
jgi:hypothetical protein